MACWVVLGTVNSRSDRNAARTSSENSCGSCRISAPCTAPEGGDHRVCAVVRPVSLWGTSRKGDGSNVQNSRDAAAGSRRLTPASFAE